MIAIKHVSGTGFLYPVSYTKAGQVIGRSVSCGPFPKDFGTVAIAKKVIADLKAAGKMSVFKVVRKA